MVYSFEYFMKLNTMHFLLKLTSFGPVLVELGGQTGSKFFETPLKFLEGAPWSKITALKGF